jgi:hypothetical protein
LVRVIVPDWPGFTTAISLLLYAGIMFLTYRLTHIALKRSHAYTAGFFVVLMVGSLFVMILLQGALGISLPDPVTIG